MSTFVIAEGGKNWLTREDISMRSALHNAKSLVDVARTVGADAVKFQCHVASDEIKKRHPDRHDWIRRNEELTPFLKFWEPLKRYCDKVGIEFMVTPMSKMAAEKMEPLVKRWKVASPDALDVELLQYLKDTNKDIILSSGMTTDEERQRAAAIAGDRAFMLHCVSEYPVSLERANLWEVDNFTGLSDHTTSLITGALAVMRGAQIVEKHFTISDEGKDAEVSLKPSELLVYIENIRDAEKALIKNKRPTDTERRLRRKFVV